ncbi:hypothetical protein AB834_01205 [PVC group bacterium (ex Bugula neritina AB1)]|nr:hypothetical protein AB834_01205 [PVC group bacterium (ex Bugula neritina AB1)]
MKKVQWVLHAHLPYVCHKDLSYCLEHDWFFEALTETYIPLIFMLQRLKKKKYRNVLTLSLSPTLIKMMENSFLLEQYHSYLYEHMNIFYEYAEGFKGDKNKIRLVEHYIDHYQSVCDYVSNMFPKGLIKDFADLSKEKVISLITTSQSHAYLPLWHQDKQLIQDQILYGCDEFEKALGVKPRGFWLPECGYVPNLEQYLKQRDIEYFFLETHGVLQASPQPSEGAFYPLRCPNGIMAWGRDSKSTKWIWSATQGYPGAFGYRDFYANMGMEEDTPLLRKYHKRRGVISHTGFKHRRVGYFDQKSLYDPFFGKKLAIYHAFDWVSRLKDRFSQVHECGLEDPWITLCFDAELFGHWWWEGMTFLEKTLDILKDSRDIQILTPEVFLDGLVGDKSLGVFEAQPSMSSWGKGGYHRMWLNPSNDWIFKNIRYLREKYEDFSGDDFERERCEDHFKNLLSSDWPFMISSGSSQQYASQRVRYHMESIANILSVPLELK